MKLIGIDFDFRQDSKCGDPDTDSRKLYQAHQLLWSKEFLTNTQITSTSFKKSWKTNLHQIQFF